MTNLIDCYLHNFSVPTLHNCPPASVPEHRNASTTDGNINDEQKVEIKAADRLPASVISPLPRSGDFDI